MRIGTCARPTPHTRHTTTAMGLAGLDCDSIYGSTHTRAAVPARRHATLVFRQQNSSSDAHVMGLLQFEALVGPNNLALSWG